MSAYPFHIVRALVSPKVAASIAAALMLSACSNAMERFASNPSDSDPVYTATVPGKKAVLASEGTSGDDAIVSKPLSNASPAAPSYNYGNQTAKAPTYKQSTPAVPQVAAVEAPVAAPGGTVTVGQGMTLYAIARANNLPVSKLAAANNIRPPYAVHAGQVIRIPGLNDPVTPQVAAVAQPAEPVAAAPSGVRTGSGTHVVASGETMYSLARKYGVSPASIAEANGLSRTAQLAVGQTIRIPGAPSSNLATKAPIPPASEELGGNDTAAPQTAETQMQPLPGSTLPSAGTTVAKSETAQVPEVPAAAPVADASAAGMRWPVRGKVISGFGAKPNGLKNEGINIAVPEGTSIRAAEGGVVAYAGNELKGYGNLILIRHEGGYVTAYAHAKEIFVKRGDTVKRGDVIAKAGQTGSVSSPQLHFEVRKGATALDPMKFLSSTTASN